MTGVKRIMFIIYISFQKEGMKVVVYLPIILGQWIELKICRIDRELTKGSAVSAFSKMTRFTVFSVKPTVMH